MALQQHIYCGYCLMTSHNTCFKVGILLRRCALTDYLRGNMMAIVQGKLTYDAEGMEGGRYHSRVLHVPSGTSGLTIGRGYDMKEKKSSKIEADMLAAGVDAANAATLGKAAHLSGSAAKSFISDNNLGDFEISMDTQEKLFASIYAELSKDVQRICNKADCVAAYGSVDWANLDDKIKDVLVDLRFRGDYTGRTRRLMQRFAAKNDLASFAAELSNRDNWASVPQDRFNRRVKYLNA
ncbi:MAG: hypothetical protein Q9M28_04670 [Mariprofundaceae bacterium]|nr:hypothetical protein [Mariprofundaceae bacterium]